MSIFFWPKVGKSVSGIRNKPLQNLEKFKYLGTFVPVFLRGTYLVRCGACFYLFQIYYGRNPFNWESSLLLWLCSLFIMLYGLSIMQVRQNTLSFFTYVYD